MRVSPIGVGDPFGSPPPPDRRRAACKLAGRTSSGLTLRARRALQLPSSTRMTIATSMLSSVLSLSKSNQVRK